MMNDSVREDLEIKAVPAAQKINFEKKGVSLMSSNPNQSRIPAPSKPVFAKRDTADLIPKPSVPLPKTESPTLVEFQTKTATLPDWRLKMQNAVRQRLEHQPEEEKAITSAVYQTRLVTSGANALKAEIVEEPAPVQVKNEKVANALKRIEQSRKAFLVEEPDQVSIEAQPNQNKNYPFYIAARTAENAPKPAENKASINVPLKPKLVTATRNANGDLDTNKLPRLPQILPVAAESDKVSASIPGEAIETKKDEIPETLNEENVAKTEPAEAEEIDDIAPFSMRFNAGIFDLIIGSFASLILLAPFMLAGGEWLTFTGFMAFAATVSIVMFIYLTTAIGMFGRSFGMRLFALELVDVEENEYPTFHQAAVSSSVYLLSLVFGGIGFLTVLFNEEKRAVHDIVSGTIVVKEY
jgi:uncharacterized RDD family membrane protein YckC